MKIALLGKYFGWGGGAEFLRNVAIGLLTKQKERDLSLYLFLPMHRLDIIRVVRRSVNSSINSRRPTLVLSKPDYYQAFPDYFEDLKDRVEIIYYDKSDHNLLHCLKKTGIDIILPVFGSLGSEYPIPWIGYIADFQHKYYPGNFKSHECFDRDTLFADILKDVKNGTWLIQTRRAMIFNNFFPNLTAIPLCAAVFTDTGLNLAWMRAITLSQLQYELPDRYFLISNQFWIHKDHLTAFKALLIATMRRLSVQD